MITDARFIRNPDLIKILVIWLYHYVSRPYSTDYSMFWIYFFQILCWKGLKCLTCFKVQTSITTCISNWMFTERWKWIRYISLSLWLCQVLIMYVKFWLCMSSFDCVYIDYVTWLCLRWLCLRSYRFVRDFAWELAGRARKSERAIDTQAISLLYQLSFTWKEFADRSYSTPIPFPHMSD